MSWFVGVFLAAAPLLASGAAGEQVEISPAFDVASVKPSTGLPTRDARGQRQSAGDPTRLALHYETLRSLILRAYQIDSWQLTGERSWIDEDHFDVEARSAKPATHDEMLLMLRTLLSDCFHLILRRAARAMPVNVLVVASGGPKFGPHFHETTSTDQGSSAAAVPGQFPIPRVTMKELARILQANLLRALDPVTGEPAATRGELLPIVDETGITGTYDISVTIQPVMIWPAILERQLGLKLEKRTAPVEIFGSAQESDGPPGFVGFR